MERKSLMFPVTSMSTSKNLIDAAANLRDAVDALTFSPPVTHVYNPIDYAWEAHKLYLTNYANSTKRVVMLGMNPGGFGTALGGLSSRPLAVDELLDKAIPFRYG